MPRWVRWVDQLPMRKDSDENGYLVVRYRSNRGRWIYDVRQGAAVAIDEARVLEMEWLDDSDKDEPNKDEPVEADGQRFIVMEN